VSETPPKLPVVIWATAAGLAGALITFGLQAGTVMTRLETISVQMDRLGDDVRDSRSANTVRYNLLESRVRALEIQQGPPDGRLD